MRTARIWSADATLLSVMALWRSWKVLIVYFPARVPSQSHQPPQGPVCRRARCWRSGQRRQCSGQGARLATHRR